MAGALLLSLVWQNTLSGMGCGSLLTPTAGTRAGIKETGCRQAVEGEADLASVPLHLIKSQSQSFG